MSHRRLRLLLPAIGVAAFVAPWVSAATTEAEQGMPTSIIIQSRPDNAKRVEGKVVDVKPSGPMVTMLKLDNGTQLIVPAAANEPGREARVGASVMALYVETEQGNIVTFIRVPDIQAP